MKQGRDLRSQRNRTPPAPKWFLTLLYFLLNTTLYHPEVIMPLLFVLSPEAENVSSQGGPDRLGVDGSRPLLRAAQLGFLGVSWGSSPPCALPIIRPAATRREHQLLTCTEVLWRLLWPWTEGWGCGGGGCRGGPHCAAGAGTLWPVLFSE